MGTPTGRGKILYAIHYLQDWFATHPCPSGTQLNPDSASQYPQQVSEASAKIGLGGIKWKHKRWKFYRDGPYICWPTKRTTTLYSKYNATFSASMDTQNRVHPTWSTMYGHSLLLGKKQSTEHSVMTKTPKQFNATSTQLANTQPITGTSPQPHLRTS